MDLIKTQKQTAVFDIQLFAFVFYFFHRCYICVGLLYIRLDALDRDREFVNGEIRASLLSRKCEAVWFLADLNPQGLWRRTGTRQGEPGRPAETGRLGLESEELTLERVQAEAEDLYTVNQ